MKTAFYGIVLLLTGIAFGQNSWDFGDLEFQYGSPFPDEQVSISGSFINTEIPAQGVGGFEISRGDTNFLSLVAYDLHVSDTDTLADIFALIIKDTVAISEGYHVVGFDTDVLKLFIWMEDVDPQLIAALIDTSFTVDSLSVLDPYISLSGQIEITEIGPGGISGNFAGVMASTNMGLIIVNNGLFQAASSLPVLEYTSGVLLHTEDGQIFQVEGDLNPLQNDAGVGATTSQRGDTLTTHLYAYQPDADGGLSIYGMMLHGQPNDYPASGDTTLFPVDSYPSDLPSAMPYFLKHASLSDLTLLLSADSLPAPGDFDSLYFPVAMDTVAFSYPAMGGITASFENLLFANGSGETLLVSQTWELGPAGTTGIVSSEKELPENEKLVGQAYPNPFNGSVVLPFRLSDDAWVTLKLYNLQGQLVHSRNLGFLTQGTQAYRLDLNGSTLAGGIYVFTLSTNTGQHGSGSLLYLK